jgi:NAD(P)-dependent dehydrogenase (short-subunit alcohol dehydrogenase family)
MPMPAIRYSGHGLLSVPSGAGCGVSGARGAGLEEGTAMSSYEAHNDMSGRVTTGFTAASTAADVIDGIDLHGKRAIVTGGSSGIGVETARALAGAGAEVTLAVRSTDAGQHVAETIAASTGTPVSVERLDLSDLASVSDFVSAWSGPLHVLVNNAGVMAPPQLQLNQAGWEIQFATDHLGHFALAHGLHAAMAAAGNARIVSLSSNGHLMSPVQFEDINFTHHPYDEWVAYGQSKSANALFAVCGTAHWAGDGITVNAVHPGAVAETNLSRHMDPEVLRQLRTGGTYTYKTTAQGAATSVLVATSPLLEGIGGRYFENCNEAEPVDGDQAELAARRSGVAAYARDPGLAERLWDLSLKAIV